MKTPGLGSLLVVAEVPAALGTRHRPTPWCAATLYGADGMSGVPQATRRGKFKLTVIVDIQFDEIKIQVLGYDGFVAKAEEVTLSRRDWAEVPS